jgi:hypothetical protein
VSFQPSSLGVGGFGRGGETQVFVGHVLEGVEGAAVEDLEAHQMNVHGVGVFSLVDELPGGGELRTCRWGDGGYFDLVA